MHSIRKPYFHNHFPTYSLSRVNENIQAIQLSFSSSVGVFLKLALIYQGSTLAFHAHTLCDNKKAVYSA